ncbi:YicC family protein [Rhodobacteraceae bacterium CCMM004]|nr:YicC family protein [Rhodobacteraceae bacterium CCMM004]
MTGYATLTGAAEGWSWVWEVRSVNSRGLDLRLRVPDAVDGLDPPLRKAVQAVAARGAVTLSLKLTRDEAAAGPALDPAALSGALDAVRQIEAAAAANGMPLAPVRATDVLSIRGVMDPGGTRARADVTALRGALLADVTDRLLPAFDAMRAEEGRAMAAVLGAQLDEIARLTAAAAAAAEARAAKSGDALRAAVARVTQATDAVEPERLAQELALIAVKSDVTEEIDRLTAHVDAARGHLAAGGPLGRKLDFLTQEFNREANTLCAKAQSADLTRIGLDLKTVIDQMREQVQNLE